MENVRPLVRSEWVKVFSVVLVIALALFFIGLRVGQGDKRARAGTFAEENALVCNSRSSPYNEGCMWFPREVIGYESEPEYLEVAVWMDPRLE